MRVLYILKNYFVSYEAYQEGDPAVLRGANDSLGHSAGPST